MLRSREAVAIACLLGGVACAESGSIDVLPGGPEPSGGGSLTEDPGCAAPQFACGGGCCNQGEACSEGSCIQTTACTTNDDCFSDSFCGPGGACQPWSSSEGPGVDTTCRTEVQLAGIQPTVQCQWPGAQTPSEYPNSVQVIGTPMVVDFNADGDPNTWHPSIVFVSYEGLFGEGLGRLRIMDGETCQLQHSVAGQFNFVPEISPALGDLNGDGIADIVVADREQTGTQSFRYGLAAYSLAGGAPQLLWRRRVSSSGDLAGIALHDLDNDAAPEILTATTILRANGDEILTLPPDSYEPPLVLDIDRDLEAEVVTSQGIFYFNSLDGVLEERQQLIRGTAAPFWDNTQKEAGVFMAAADLMEVETRLDRGMDSAELVLIGFDGALQVKAIDGVTMHRVAGTGVAGGPPVIADFDGDGRMEFGSPGRTHFTVYDLDCKPGATFNAQGCAAGQNTDAVLWQTPIQAAESGASVFDFDDNGVAEVVYADQCFLRVYDGRNGQVLFSVSRSSVTQWEYPVIADVDGDGRTELVTASNDASTSVRCPATDPMFPSAVFQASHGVTVWREPDDLWVGSRPIWNQHLYYVNNVNDDGTIPATFEVKSSWDADFGGGPNTFRQNVQGETGASLSIPDLTTAGLAQFRCSGETRVDVSVELCNRGLEPLRPGEAQASLSREVDGALQVVATVQVEDGLAPGQCNSRLATIERQAGEAPFDLIIDGDPTQAIDECAETNNRSMISEIFCASGPL